jgi:hypothetical protein
MTFKVGDPVLLNPDLDAQVLAHQMGLSVDEVKTLLPPQPYIGTVTNVNRLEQTVGRRVRYVQTCTVKWDHLKNDGDEYNFTEHELRTAG